MGAIQTVHGIINLIWAQCGEKPERLFLPSKLLANVSAEINAGTGIRGAVSEINGVKLSPEPAEGYSFYPSEQMGALRYALPIMAKQLGVQPAATGPATGPVHNECECGSDSAGCGGHSSWCPKFGRVK